MNSATAGQERITADLTLGSERIRLQLELPRSRVQAVQLLPLLQALADEVIAVGVREAEARGRMVRCHKGCGACCVQLVPLSEPEAVSLLQLVDALPAGRQRQIRERFARNRRRLEEAGILDAILSSVTAGDRGFRREIGIRYFELGLPCPFLEQGACSIHPHRPLSCREYLVVSAPDECARPQAGGVEKVVFPRNLSSVLYTFGDGEGRDSTRVLPLTLLPDWGDAHPPERFPWFEPAAYLEAFLRRLAAAP